MNPIKPLKSTTNLEKTRSPRVLSIPIQCNDGDAISKLQTVGNATGKRIHVLHKINCKMKKDRGEPVG